MVNVYKQLGLGTDLHDPITDERIHSMGAMYVDDLDMYTWKDTITCYRRYVDKIGRYTILLLSSIPYHWIGTMGRCQVIRLL